MQRHVGPASRDEHADGLFDGLGEVVEPSGRDVHVYDADADSSSEPEPATGPQPLPATPSRSVGWGVLGFVIGAVFWHFIGFWSFVSEIVFTGRPAGPERVVEQTGPRCVEVVLDRETRSIAARTCPDEAPSLNESAYAVREDFGGTRGMRSLARSGWLPHIRLSSDDQN